MITFVRRFFHKIPTVVYLLVGYAIIVLFISDKQYSLNAQINGMLVRVRSLEHEQVQIGEMQERFAEEVNRTGVAVRGMDVHLEQLVQYSKRHNLLLGGIEESTDERDGKAELAETVRGLIGEHMGIDLGPKDLEYAYRIKENGTNPRSVLVKFARWKDKNRVLHRRKSLPAELKVEEDFTEMQRKKRRKLGEMAAEAEKLGKRVKWNGKHLFIGGKEVKVDISKL